MKMAVVLLQRKLEQFPNQDSVIEMPRSDLQELYNTIMEQQRKLEEMERFREVIGKLSGELNEQVTAYASSFVPQEKRSIKPIVTVCLFILTLLALSLAKLNQNYHIFPPARRIA